MSGLELNKIAAAVLVAGITGIVVAKTAAGLYAPEAEPKTRGYTIEVAENTGAGDAAKKDVGPVDITLHLASASAEKGQSLTKPCATCHSFEQGGPDKVGPNLWGTVGNHRAHKDGYAYSSGMLEHKGEKWDFQSLSEFLEKPAKYVPGTKMAFAGIKKPEDRAAVIVYLNSLGSNLPIPAAPAAPAEEAPAQ